MNVSTIKAMPTRRDGTGTYTPPVPWTAVTMAPPGTLEGVIGNVSVAGIVSPGLSGVMVIPTLAAAPGRREGAARRQ
ncbi:MAG: hypothetical protein IPG81_10065 [Sandaracinaceae bacterium]|nr:hypothetical protein [Sandaracinaceae bacterium]